MSTSLDNIYQNLRNQRANQNNNVFLNDSVTGKNKSAWLADYTGVTAPEIRNTTLNKFGDTITLTGQSDLFTGNNNQSVTVTFSLQDAESEDSEIIISVNGTFSDPFLFSSFWKQLNGTTFSTLTFTQARFNLSTADYWDNSTQTQISRGFNLSGTFTVTEADLNIKIIAPIGSVFSISALLTINDQKLKVKLRSSNGISVTVTPVGINPLNITVTRLFAETWYSDQYKGYLDRTRFIGTYSIETNVIAVIQNTSYSNQWQIGFSNQGNPPDSQQLIDLLNAGNILGNLPAALIQIADIDITDYGISIGSSDTSDTGIFLQLDLRKPWKQLPVLNKITDVTTSLDILRYKVSENFIQTTFSAKVKGKTSINNIPVGLEFIVGNNTNWDLSIMPEESVPLPGITDITSLTGNTDFDSTLPSNMNSSAMLTVKKLQAGFNVRDFILNYTAVSFEVNGTWYIIPQKLGLEGVKIDLKVNTPQTAPSVTGSFAGNIVIPEANVTIPFLAFRNTTTVGWTIAIAKNTFVPIPGVPALLSLANADSLADYLPSAISTLDNFVLSDIQFNFAAADNSLERFSFYIGQQDEKKPWKIIGDKLMISGLNVNLFIDYPLDINQRIITGNIGGNLTVAGISIPVYAQKADALSGWNILIADNQIVELPGLSDVFNAFDASEYFNNFPPAIRTFPTLWFSNVNIMFKPASDDLETVMFEVGTNSQWTLLQSARLIIGKIKAGLKIDYSQNPKTYTGKIEGSVSAFDTNVNIVAERPTVADPWILKLKSGQNIHVPNGLSALAAWMAPGDMQVFLPDYLLPFPDGFDVKDLSMDLNLTDFALKQIGFRIENTAPWNIVKGNLSMDGVIVQSQITQFSPDVKVSNVLLQGNLNVGGATLTMKAGKSDPDALWNFAADLANPVTLDFYKMMEDTNTKSSFNISSLAPSSVTITQFSANIIPEIQSYKFNGSGELQWSIPFGFTNLDIKKLGGELEIKETAVSLKAFQNAIPGLTDADGNAIIAALKTNKFITAEGLPLSKINSGQPLGVPSHETEVKQFLTNLLTQKEYAAKISGNFSFASIDALVQLQFGSLENTILTAVLTPEQVAALDTTQVATQLTTGNGNNNSSWSDLPVSTDFNQNTFKPGGLSSVYLSFDFSSKLFAFYGQSTIYHAAAAFMAKKLDKKIAAWSFEGLTKDTPPSGDTSTLSTTDSEVIWKELASNGFIDNDGNILPAFNPASPGFSLNLSLNYQPYSGNIQNAIQTIQNGDNWGYFVAAGLNQGFKFESIDSGLSVIDQYISVQNASIAVSSFSADSVQALTSNVPGFDQAITISGSNAVKIGKGVNFFAQMNFSSDLFGNVIKIMQGNDGTPAATLYAYISSDVTASVFQAKFPNIILLGGISFTNVNFQYKVAKESELSLCGTVTIPIGDSSLPFHGSFVINDSMADFKMQAGGDINPCAIGNTLPQPAVINAPLGMSGINIETPQLEVLARFKDELGNKLDKTSINWAISGGVFFKDGQGNPVLGVRGNVIFDGGTPVVVSVLLQDENHLPSTLNIGNFLNTIFGTSSWNFLDISFTGGGVFYVKCPDNADTCKYLGTDYVNGFSAKTTIGIYGHQFGIAVRVISSGPAEKQGITFSGFPVTPIDLDFIQLYGVKENPQNPPGGKIFDKTIGPIVGVSFLQNTKYFSLDFGFALFQTDIGIGHLAYSTASQQFDGSVTYSGPLAIPGNPELRFTWDDTNGFKITEWPLQNMLPEEVMKIAETMQQISKTDGNCGELVGLAFEEAINTHFNMKATQKSGSCATHDGKAALCFDITGTYSIDIAGHQNVVSASLPTITLTIPLPEQFNLSGLATLVKDTIVENAASIIKQFFSDPAKLTAFFGLVAVGKFSGELLGNLMCRDVKSNNIKEASESKANTEEPEGEEALEEAETLAEEAAAEGATVGEAAAAAAGAEGAADVAIGVFAVVIGLFTGLIALFDADYRRRKEEAEAKKQRADEARRKAQEAVKKKLKVSGISIIYGGGDSVTVSWHPVTGGNITYEYQVKAGNDVIGQQSGYSNSSVVIDDSRISSNSHLYAQVRATVSGVADGKNYSYTGDWTTTEVEILPKPVVTQTYSGSSKILTAVWPRIDNASGYYAQVVVTDKDNIVAAILDNIPQTGNAQINADFDTTKFTVSDGGQYQIWVKAIGRNGFHDSSFGVASTFTTRLSPPASVTQSLNKINPDAGITGTWQILQQATGYNAKVVNTSLNQVVSSVIYIPNDPGKSTLSHLFTMNDMTAPQPGILTVEVQAIGNDMLIDSAYSVSTQGTVVIDSPGGVTQTLIKPQNHLSVQWPSVVSQVVTGYSVLLYNLNLPVGSTPVYSDTITKNENNQPLTKIIDLSGFVTDQASEFLVKINTLADSTAIDSPFASAVSSTKGLAAPAGLTLNYDITTRSIPAGWQNVPDASEYMARILDITNSDNPVASKTVALPQQGQNPGYTFTQQDFTSTLNSLYKLTVQALGSPDVINSIPTSGNPLPVPDISLPILSLIYIDGNIIADWQVTDSRVTQYILQLYNDQGTPVGNEVQTDKTNYSFPVTNPADNTSYSVKIKVNIGTYESGWSTAYPVTINLVPAPADLQTGTDGISVIAAWKEVITSDSYQVVIKKSDGSLLVPAVSVTVTQALTTSSVISQGQTYSIEVRAIKGQSFSPAIVSDLVIQQMSTSVIYLRQAFDTDGSTFYLGNGQTMNWGNSYRNMQAVAVEDITADTVTPLIANQSQPEPWFPFAFNLQNLQRTDGYQNGDLVTIKGFDQALNSLNIQSTDGANGPYSWSLSQSGNVSNLNQVFRLYKWIGNDGSGNAEFGSGPINSGDYIMLLVLGHNSVNTSMNSGPEAVTWKSEINPQGRNLKLPQPQDVVLSITGPAQLTLNLKSVIFATIYKAELWNEKSGTAPLITNEITGDLLNPAPHTTFDISPYAQNPDGVKYQVKVKAENNNGFSGEHEMSGKIDQLAQTQITSFSYNKPEIRSGWNQVPDATLYSMLVFQNGTVVKTTDTGNTSEKLNVSDLQPGSYFFGVKAKGSASVIQGPVSALQPFVIADLNPGQFAQQKKLEGYPALQTASALHQHFPAITATDFAIAMANAPYSKDDTVKALKQEFPQLTPQQFAQVILAAFPPTSPDDLVKKFHDQGVAVEVTSRELSRYFPALTPAGFAVALATGGYDYIQVRIGLRQQYPQISNQEFISALQAAFPALSPAELAKREKEAGYSVLQTASSIHQSFQGISAVDFAVALAAAPYSKEDIVAALKQEFPQLTPEQFAKALMAAFPATSPDDFARKYHDQSVSVEITAKELIRNFPALNANDFAVALAKGGYDSTKVTIALKQEFPRITAWEFVTALLTAFPPVSAEELAKKNHEHGVSAEQTSSDLMRHFPSLDSLKFAVAMAGGGYDHSDVISGLKKQFPGLSPEQFADAMLEAFPERTPESLAEKLKKKDVGPEHTAKKLLKNFPDLNAKKVAKHMASAGYSKSDVKSGLKEAFRGIGDDDLKDALKAAFND
jgi:hypothetical protein